MTVVGYYNIIIAKIVERIPYTLPSRCHSSSPLSLKAKQCKIEHSAFSNCYPVLLS
jgi:hypothetical protein